MIAATGSIGITGEIRSNGGWTQHGESGGGTGGGIRLVSETLTGSSAIRALGGAGWWSGHVGRIRIERVTNNNLISVAPDPSLVTLAAGATAVLWPPEGAPEVKILSVGGLAASADPRANFGTQGADVELPQTTSAEVLIETRNTPYYYRAVVVGPNGTAIAGEIAAFVTAVLPPVATTRPPESVTETSATLAGRVVTNGADTVVWFEYGATALYGNVVDLPARPGAAGAAEVSLTTVLGNLTPGATYHYRLVAANAGGTAYGQDVVFEAVATGGGGTPTAAPTVVTGGASGLDPGLATLSGQVTPRGGNTLAWFEYGPTTAYGAVSSARSAGSGTTPVAVALPVAGLEPRTLYHYRLVAENSAGVSYGADATFTTSDAPPVVATGGAVALSTTSARLSGRVRARHATARVFFDYGTDGVSFPHSVAAAPATVGGDTETAVSADLTNLQQEVTYITTGCGHKAAAARAGGTWRRWRWSGCRASSSPFPRRCRRRNARGP